MSKISDENPPFLSIIISFAFYWFVDKNIYDIWQIDFGPSYDVDRRFRLK